MPIMPYGLDVVGDGPDFVGSRAAALTLRPALVLDLTSELLPFPGLVEYVDGVQVPAATGPSAGPQRPAFRELLAGPRENRKRRIDS